MTLFKHFQLQTPSAILRLILWHLGYYSLHTYQVSCKYFYPPPRCARWTKAKTAAVDAL